MNALLFGLHHVADLPLVKAESGTHRGIQAAEARHEVHPCVGTRVSDLEATTLRGDVQGGSTANLGDDSFTLGLGHLHLLAVPDLLFDGGRGVLERDEARVARFDQLEHVEGLPGLEYRTHVTRKGLVESPVSTLTHLTGADDEGEVRAERGVLGPEPEHAGRLIQGPGFAQALE